MTTNDVNLKFYRRTNRDNQGRKITKHNHPNNFMNIKREKSVRDRTGKKLN